MKWKKRIAKKERKKPKREGWGIGSEGVAPLSPRPLDFYFYFIFKKARKKGWESVSEKVRENLHFKRERERAPFSSLLFLRSDPFYINRNFLSSSHRFSSLKQTATIPILTKIIHRFESRWRRHRRWMIFRFQ